MNMLVDKFTENIESLLNYNLPNNLAIAVSGGADSLALLLLLNEWLKYKQPNLNLIVLTVNHNLRSTSHKECLYVENISNALGYSCQILNWFPTLPISNLQAKARKARYDLMTEYCNVHNVKVLITGHHQDDYIENFIIRNNRKSGKFGLSSANVHFCNGVKIIRPLYNIFKTDLNQYLKQKNIQWIEDESNLNEKFTRVKIRKDLSKIEFATKREKIHQQQSVDNDLYILKQKLIISLAESCNITPYGFSTINLELFKHYAYVIRLQILSYILTISGGKEHGPRGRCINLLITLMEENYSFTNSLHGCIIKKVDSHLVIWRSFGKTNPSKIPLKPNLIWDNRFIIKSEFEAQELIITNLNMHDYKEIKEEINLDCLSMLSLKNHKKILFTLPVIKKLEKVVAIPNISFYRDNDLQEKFKLIYYPKFISRFIHFA